MKWIDTHTHLFLDAFDTDRDQVIGNAVDRGISKMLLPNIDSGTIDALKATVRKYPENCLPMMGLHPSSVKENFETEIIIVEEELASGNYIAVGETGIDLYWDDTFIDQQKLSFRKHVEWAIHYKLPLVIHARESFIELFEILDEMNSPSLKGVFHCFTGGREEADHILSYGGFKMGIGGVVTFKKSDLSETLKNYKPEDFILETDSPFLAPSPHRGKRNESAFLIFVAEKLCETWEISMRELSEISCKTAEELFQLKES